jgi:hypothetical protein
MSVQHDGFTARLKGEMLVRIDDSVMLKRGFVAVVARLLACIIAVYGATLSAVAHEIPSDVKINAFVKPAGNRLELLLRVPMGAMREVEFPTRGPGYIDLPRAEESLRNAAQLWFIDNIDVYENDERLARPRIAQVRISLPSDKSFTSYEEARRHVEGPRLADDLEVYWNQQLLDVLLEYPIRSEGSDFAISFRVERFGIKVVTALLFLPPDGAVRAFEFHGDPGLLRLDPRWHQAALRFVVSGFWHILEGSDHLLFLACLVIPFRRLRPLVIIVTAFTVAHSIALIASAMGFVPDALWFPPLIETLIAVTIILMALENIVSAARARADGRELGATFDDDISRRWMVAFAFGIIHGFGFAFALRETFQFAGDHLVTALLSFNIGVEIGQLLVLVVLVPALALFFRHVLAERLGIIILSVLVAHIAWHWMIERGGELAKYPFPTLNAAFLASLMRGLMAALILGGLVALVNGLVKRWMVRGEDKALETPAART